jgi:hypothetical protein
MVPPVPVSSMTGIAEGPVNPMPPQESAEALLAELVRLEQAGAVLLQVDVAGLGHIDSPVASEAEGNLWLYPFLALAALLWWQAGPAFAGGALAAGIALYLTLGRAQMRRSMTRRVRERGMASLDNWRRLWRFTGLTLRAAHRPELAPCASPDGNWMEFVRALR